MNILNEIFDYDFKTLELVLGRHLDGLLRFIFSVDKTHPHVLDPIGKNNSKFICDILKISKFSLENNIDINLIKKDFLNSLSQLDSPLINKKNIRLLSSYKNKILARKLFNIKNIDLSHFLEKSETIWGRFPSNFNFYGTDHKNQLEKEIEKAQNIADRYEQLEFFEMSNDIKSSIDIFKKTLNYNYNYVKISLLTASVILSKISNVNYKDIKKGNFVTKLYPLHFIQKNLSKEINRIIFELDEFPQANYKSIFDNYFILISSFRGAQLKDDIAICKKGYSILVGQKDEKYYFISTWK
jgi:hypothetical protein